MTKPPSHDRARRSANSSSEPEAAPIRQFNASNLVIDFNVRAYAAHKLAALADTLTQAGVEVKALLADSSLTDAQLRSAETRISYRQMATVFRNALQLSPDPAFALRAGQRMHVTAYGMYGYALMSSPSHEAALEFAFKYHMVMGPVATMNLTLSHESAAFSYDPILSSNPRDDLYRACAEFIFASQLTLDRDLYGASFRFARISFAYAVPANAESYHQAFGCPIEFGRSRNEIKYESTWIREPVPFSDPITNTQAHELCDQVFRGLRQTRSITARIQRLLIDHPGWFPRVDAMAEQLSMTPRTLHRKLEAERTTYRGIVAELRMNLAIDYLRKTSMTNEEIAARLGYGDAANFRHAFHRWTGKSPSEYRS
jgi:AraC-like DNA-binding protein